MVSNRPIWQREPVTPKGIPARALRKARSGSGRVTASELMTRGLVDLRFRVSGTHPDDVLSGVVMTRSFAKRLQADAALSEGFCDHFVTSGAHPVTLAGGFRLRRLLGVSKPQPPLRSPDESLSTGSPSRARLDPCGASSCSSSACLPGDLGPDDLG